MRRLISVILASLIGTLTMTAEAQTLPPLPSTISKEARAAIEALGAAPQTASASIEDTRKQIAMIQNMVGTMQSKRYAVVKEHSSIAGVPVIIYKPADGVKSNGILLNLHGGGFIVDSGSQTENIPIASLTGMTVIAVLYRLAPEHPFPAAVDDAAAVYGKLLETTAPKDIAVFGSSAGAVLSAQLMVRLQCTKTPLPAALGFFSGGADLGSEGDSEGFLPKMLGGSARASMAPYIGTTPVDTPALSPLFADLSGFPPTLVMTSTRDQLLSHSTIFHRALLRANVDARLVVFEAMPHAFWAYIMSPESDEAFNLMADFFRNHLK